MAVQEALGIGNSVINNFPSEVSSTLINLITILKVAGIVVIIYIIFLLVRGISTWRRNKRIDKTYELVNDINNKLDKVLKNKKIKKK